MYKYIGALTIVFLVAMVITRIWLLKKQGIKAMKFGEIDKKDFLIPPFAFFYFYLVFANAFSLPTIAKQQLFNNEIIAWLGVLLMLLRIGIDILQLGFF